MTHHVEGGNEESKGDSEYSVDFAVVINIRINDLLECCAWRIGFL